MMMAGRSAFTVALLVALVGFAAIGNNHNLVEAQVNCPDVVATVSKCMDFLGGSVKKPTPECCAGLGGLLTTAKKSVPDRRAICKCLTDAASKVHVDLSKISDLANGCLSGKRATAIVPNDVFLDCDKI